MAWTCESCGGACEQGLPYCPGCGAPAREPEEAPPVIQRAKLVVIRHPGSGTEYELVDGVNELGRRDAASDCYPHVDLTGHDPEGYVHRRHAAIRKAGERWWLEHVKPLPSNPTRIRGRTAALVPGEPVALQPGDEIVIGRVVLRFVMVEQPLP